MTDRSYQHNGYLYVVYETLRDKIDYFIENYNPLNLSIAGTTALHGDTTIGDNSSNLLTINADTTCNGTFDFNNGVTVNGSLHADDNVVIGQTSTDELTVNANSTFNALVTLDGTTEDGGNTGLQVSQNAIFGTDTNNYIISRGVVNAPQFTIPIVSDNALNMGTTPVILYHEYSTNGANIWSDYGSTGNVILTIKNVYSGSGGSASITIIYNSSDSSIVLAHNAIATFMKSSTTAYTRIQ